MLERPLIQKRLHPIYTGFYYIQTNSIDELRSEVENWIDNRNPGGIIYGKARIGKTRAIHNLKLALKDTYGDKLPIIVFNMSEHKPSEKFFYLELLKDLNHSLAKSSRSSSDLKTNAVNHLITLGKAYEMSRVILFIDEANFMCEDDYNYLIDFYNRLERASVQLTVLLVGTEEILSTKSTLIQTNKQQIVGRFMIREYRFRGVNNLNDLQICLASYDYSEYPTGSGWSFTRYFFPDAYEEGNRLNQIADTLYECYLALKKGNIKEIPMQYVTSTIENCFRKYGADGLGMYFPTQDEWEKSILASGYLAAETISDMCTAI